MGRALHLHLHLLDSRVTAQVVSAYVLQRGSVKPAQQYSHRSYTRPKQVHAQIVRSQRLFHRCSESRALGMRTLLNPMKPLQRIVVELRSQRQAMREVALPHEQQCAGLQQLINIGDNQHVTLLSCLRALQIRRDVI